EPAHSSCVSIDAHSSVDIVDLDPPQNRVRAAELLVEGFRQHWPDAWPDLDAALVEVDDVVAAGPARVAIDDSGVLGWAGVQPLYRGRVWELHPLVVDQAAWASGIGRALVDDAERIVAARGGLTLYVGTDDENEMTSIGGIDVYPDPLDHLSRIRDV